MSEIANAVIEAMDSERNNKRKATDPDQSTSETGWQILADYSIMIEDIDSLLYARVTPPESLSIRSDAGAEESLPNETAKSAQNDFKRSQPLNLSTTTSTGLPIRPQPERQAHVAPFGTSAPRFGQRSNTLPSTALQRKAPPPPPIPPKPQAQNNLTAPPSPDVLTILVQELLNKFDEQRNSIDELQKQVKLLLARQENTTYASAPMSLVISPNEKSCQAGISTESAEAQTTTIVKRNVRVQHCTACDRCGLYSGELYKTTETGDGTQQCVVQPPTSSESGESNTTTSEDVSNDTLMPSLLQSVNVNVNSMKNGKKQKRVTYASNAMVLRETQNQDSKCGASGGRSVYVDRLAQKYLAKRDLPKGLTHGGGKQPAGKAMNVLDNRARRENRIMACPPFGKKSKDVGTSDLPSGTTSRPSKRIQEQYAVAMYSKVLYDYVRDSDDGLRSKKEVDPFELRSISPPSHSRSFSGLGSESADPILTNRSFRDLENRSPLDNRKKGRKPAKTGILASRRFEVTAAAPTNAEEAGEMKASSSKNWSFTNDSEESPLSGEDEEIAAVACAGDSDFSNVFSDDE